MLRVMYVALVHLPWKLHLVSLELLMAPFHIIGAAGNFGMFFFALKLGWQMFEESVHVIGRDSENCWLTGGEFDQYPSELL